MNKRESIRNAEQALDAGNPAAAASGVWNVLDRAHLLDQEFAQHAELLARAFEKQGKARAAAATWLYLHNDRAAQLQTGDARDTARAHLLLGDHRSAAIAYQEAGLLGHAAMHLEKSGDNRGARVLWERLCRSPALAKDPYASGLAHYNLGRACEQLGDQTAARRSTVQSIHLLEAAADAFETQGKRERAFDCFQVLLSVGRGMSAGAGERAGGFENLAEGYINCIRILQEDNLKYYVIQYYEDFQRQALERGELHAAATIFREAAEFCRNHGMPYASHYRLQAARTHAAAGDKIIRETGNVDFAENAYMAAVETFSELGAYSEVRRLYGVLSEMDLNDKRRARYAYLNSRLKNVKDEPAHVVDFPDYLKNEMAYPEVWYLDLIEWEHAGDAAETMAEVLLDNKWPSYTRRRALLACVYPLGVAEQPNSPTSQATLARLLGRVEIYSALAPLESLLKHESPDVRLAVTQASRQLFFKRTFNMVERSLADPAEAVRNEALEAVRTLHFPHAFDPLARIYRDAQNPEVRAAALESLGRIPTVEAAEMLVDVVRHGEPGDRATAAGLLTRLENREVGAILERALAEQEEGEAKQILTDVLQRRRR